MEQKKELEKKENFDFSKIEEKEISTKEKEELERVYNSLETEEEKRNFDLETYKKNYTYIPTFFKKTGYCLVKILSETQNRYILYKKHPYLNYIIYCKTTKTEIIEELLHLFEEDKPNWYLPDFKTQAEGKKELIDFISKTTKRANACINDPAQPTFFKDYMGVTYFNFFQNSELLVNPPNLENDFSTIKSIIENLTEFNKDYYNWFMDWLAFLYQNPTYRFNTSVIITGAHGAGKNLFGKVLQRIFGITCYIGNSRDLSSNFNAQLLEGKLLLIANEVLDQNNRYQFSNDIKTFITDTDISVEKKFENRYMAKNYVKCIFFGNSPNPISIEEGDRRFCVFRAKKLNLSHNILEQFALDIDGFFTNEVLGFVTHLKNRPVTSEIAIMTPIMTPAKQDIISLNETDFKGIVSDLIISLINDWKEQTKGKWLIKQEALYTAYILANPKEKISSIKFGAKLNSNGFIKLKTTVGVVNGYWIEIPTQIVKDNKPFSNPEEYTQQEIIDKFAENRNIPKGYKPEDIIKILKKGDKIYEPRTGVYKLNKTE